MGVVTDVVRLSRLPLTTKILLRDRTMMVMLVMKGAKMRSLVSFSHSIYNLRTMRIMH